MKIALTYTPSTNVREFFKENWIIALCCVLLGTTGLAMIRTARDPSDGAIAGALAASCFMYVSVLYLRWAHVRALKGWKEALQLCDDAVIIRLRDLKLKDPAFMQTVEDELRADMLDRARSRLNKSSGFWPIAKIPPNRSN